MGFFSRIVEAVVGRQEPEQSRPVLMPPSQYEEITRLKEEVDWLANMVGSDAEFTYGTDGTVQTGRKSQLGGFGGMFTYAWAYSQQYPRPGYFACFCITEPQHWIIRTRSRAFCSTNPYFKGIQKNLRTHVVGDGHRWTLVPIMPGIEVSKDALAKGQNELNDLYDGYGDANQAYRGVQCEKIERKSRDGEFFLQLMEEDRHLRVRFIEPLLVRTPVQPGEERDPRFVGFKAFGDGTESWFGIQYKAGDYERPIGYYVKRTNMFGSERADSWEAWNRPIPADQIQHGKVNVDKASPRGIPDTYWMQARLEQAIRTLRATGILAQVRSKVALIERRANVLKDSVATMVSSKGMGAIGGKRDSMESVLNLPEGGVLRSSQDTEWAMPSPNLEIKELTMAIQADLQACASAAGLADYMVSGSLGSGASYAASMVSEGPVVKSLGEMQAEMITEDRAVAMRALEIAVKHGRVPEEVLTLCKIEMNGPPLARLGIQEAQTNQIKVQGGWKSKAQCQREEGLDPDVMTEEIQQEAEADAKHQAELAKKYPELQPATQSGGGSNGSNGSTKQARNRQTPNARPMGADDEGRQIQRSSGATVEELYVDLPVDGHAGMFQRIPVKGRFQESSYEPHPQDEPTGAELEMAGVFITEEWLTKTRGEILALPMTAKPPRESPMKVEYEPGIQGVHLGIVDDQTVYAVDADAMMIKHGTMDFVVAGNHMRWDWVPADKIVVDWSYMPVDASHDLYHEAIETRLMALGKWSYSLAHKVANHFERIWLLELRPELQALIPITEATP